MPSTFNPSQREQFQLTTLAILEVELRIGQAYDALERLRQALGVRSFLTRHVRQTHGYKNTTRAQENIRRADTSVKRWAKVYRKSFSALQNLPVDASRVEGLRYLEEKDLVLLSEWLEDEEYKSIGSLSKTPNHRPLPWIWTVSPAAVSADEGAVEKAVLDWNEGVCMSKGSPNRSYSDPPFLQSFAWNMCMQLPHLIDGRRSLPYLGRNRAVWSSLSFGKRTSGSYDIRSMTTPPNSLISPREGIAHTHRSRSWSTISWHERPWMTMTRY
jgi:hypothetical protein